MALKFAKKVSSKTSGSTSDKSVDNQSPPKKKSSSSAAGWMKKGAAAQEALANEEAQAELRKAEAGKLWRFWMPEGEERQITFLDGKLDDSGMLDILMFYEHRIRVNGNWSEFVCTAEADQSQPCPICESGARSSLCGVMTIIDHTEHTIKNGPNKGKTIKNTRKLFVAKRQTIIQLTTLAKKRGGLVGCTFDVYRTGENSAGVGSQFDFQHKFATRQEIKDHYEIEDEDGVLPADYNEEIVYRSPEELLELGVGKAQTGVGYSGGTGSKKNLSDEL
ncbi:hypothetical protein JYP52_21260 [Nitratireductor aquibiodomus]|uniref:hypothetical protein n=1 Tax=Nitratireductor TaxID=245876 RepID=UPI0013AEEEB9|nr:MULTISPECIES: hypothetical protein [Nitratireductor]MBN7763670.1 hypothetical protein [Nitratireductor aquibiodomus]